MDPNLYPPITRLAEFFHCAETDFLYTQDPRVYAHWSGIQISQDFLDNCWRWPEMRAALHTYLNALPAAEIEARRQRFAALAEGIRFKHEFWVWLKEKMKAGAGSGEMISPTWDGSQYLLNPIGTRCTAETLGPAVPQAIKERWRDAETAEKAYTTWKQRCIVIMLCEEIPASPTIRAHFRCWIEEREIMPNPVLDTAWARMKKELEEAVWRRASRLDPRTFTE